MRVAIVIALVVLACRRPGSRSRRRSAIRRAGLRRQARVSSRGSSPRTTRGPKALRRALVTVSSAELPDGRTVITRDDGSYRIEALPAGRYVVRAAKDGYVSMAFGGRRPTSAGASVTVRNGETTRGTNIRLPRGAVIGGMVLDPEGQPMMGVTVVALAWRFRPGAGERRLVPAGAPAATSDDRGEYRIFGLPAGEYVIGAAVHGPAGSAGELQVISDADMRRALASLRRTEMMRSRPGIAPPPPPSPPAATEPRRPVAYAPVYFPGTANLGSATLVTVGRGEERLGADITVDYVPTARISGFALFPDASGASIQVLLSPSERALASEEMRVTRAGSTDGAFSFGAVAPGKYRLSAIARTGGTGPAASGFTEVVVSGDDLSGILVTPLRPLTLSGRVAFEGATAPPASLTGLRIPIPAVQANAAAQITVPPVELDQDGRFSVAVVPGPYRIAASLAGLRTPIGPWFLKSALVDGRDLLDAPFDFQRSVEDVVITFTDRVTEVFGRVVAPSGDGAADGYVLVFSAIRGAWFPNSRRVAAVRPRDDGTFSIRNLPPGDYYAVAVTDIDNGEWADPAVLEQLSTGAVRLTLAEGENKLQVLRVR